MPYRSHGIVSVRGIGKWWTSWDLPKSHWAAWYLNVLSGAACLFRKMVSNNCVLFGQRSSHTDRMILRNSLMPSVAWRPDLSEKKPDRCSHTGPAVPPWWGSTKVARSLRSKVFSLATARWLLKVLCLLRVPIWLCDFVVCIILCRFQTCSLDIFMDLKPLRPQVSLARTKKKWSSKHLWLHMATSRMGCGGVWCCDSRNLLKDAWRWRVSWKITPNRS